ncbi:MAG: single-stranded DNA-binding protein [Candidatus Eremiobacteraeota bacterium]|nr:single-stranded DNA-binding protein [Candidatus Eremiobacteraeota bacterium]
MASMNIVVLVGRVVGPPELRYTPGGKGVAQFTIAVDRTRGGKNGQEKETDFIPIVAWERLAEICNEYLTKGKLVSIQGALRTRTYETQDGQKRKAFEVVASEMQMLSTGEPRGGSSEGGGYRSSGQPQRNSGGGGGGNSNPPSGWGSDSGFGADDLSVDEIPF